MIRSIGLVMMTIGLLILSGFMFALFIDLIKSLIEALHDRDYFAVLLLAGVLLCMIGWFAVKVGQ